jgi:hypothetical protein
MFRNIVLAVVAAVGLTAAPELGTSTADAYPYRYYHSYYYRPYVPYVRPVIVVNPAYRYDVHFRPGPGAPWQFGGSFVSRYAADVRIGELRSESFEAYFTVR